MKNAMHSFSRRSSHGSILAYSLILLGIVLVASVGMMAASVTNLRSVSSNDKSINAFQIADSGSQFVLTSIREDSSGSISQLASRMGLSCDSSSQSIVRNGFLDGSYRVTFFGRDPEVQLRCNEDVSDTTSVKSVGTYIDVARAVKVAVSYSAKLIGWWKFNGNTDDETSGGNNGVRGGVPLPDFSPNGGPNRALDINGGTGVVTINNEPNFDLRRTISISLWFRVDNFSDEWMPIVSKMDNGGSVTSRAYSVWVNRTQRNVHLASADAAGQETVNTLANSVSPGVWHHYVGVIDRESGTLAAYIDNAPPRNGTVRSSDAVDNTFSVRIGGSFPVLYPQAFDGLIDDVRIYDGALAATDVARLYNGGRE